MKRGEIEKPGSKSDAVSKLLAFFGVGSVQVWNGRYQQMNVAYRHSRSFESDRGALAVWLRLGELEAEQQECTDYNAARFRRALKEIRGLTRAPIPGALEKAQQLCNEAGVALAPVEPCRGTALSGAAWWLNPRKAVIALSARHKTDDHLWFSLFHESAHILLHGKKTVFIDGTQAGGTRLQTLRRRPTSGVLIFLCPDPNGSGSGSLIPIAKVTFVNSPWNKVSPRESLSGGSNTKAVYPGRTLT